MTMRDEDHHVFSITIQICTNGEIVHTAQACQCVSDEFGDATIQIISQPMSVFNSVGAFASALLVALCADTNKPVPQMTINGEAMNAYNSSIN